MRYRALLLDIDGTVVGKDYLISPRVKEAIRKAKEKVLVTLCSQRQYAGFKHYVQELGLMAPQIGSGGAQIVDPIKGKELWARRIDEEVAKRIYESLKGQGESVIVNDDRLVYVDGRVEEYEGYPVPVRPVADLKNWSGVLQIVIDSIKDESWKWLEKQGGVQAVRLMSDKANGMDGYAAVLARGVSKQRGIIEYCRINKIKPEEVIAVGDDLNDYPMLMAAGLKVAMATAPEELRAMADFVCPSVDEDGVAVVIEKFIL